MPFNTYAALEQLRQMARPQQQRRQPMKDIRTHRQSLQKEATPLPPIAELSENHSWVRLTVDLPGVLARDLNVAIHDGILTISGSRQTLSVNGDAVLKKHKFSRRYAVDTDVVDVSKVNAILSLGVLTVKAPKLPRRLEHVKVDVTVSGKVMGPEYASGDVVVSRTKGGAGKPTPIAPISGDANAAASTWRLEPVVQTNVSTYGLRRDYNDRSKSPQMVKPDDESVSSESLT